jgi:hypothetical protein
MPVEVQLPIAATPPPPPPYNQEQKLLRQPHECPPHPQFNVV